MNTWKNKEDELSRARDNMVKRGASRQEAVEDTRIEQEKNNRRFDKMKKRYAPGCLV